jgi:hypothetical protein
VKRLVRIADKRNRVFLRMPEVLAALPPEASSLQWHILDLREVVAAVDSSFWLVSGPDRVLDHLKTVFRDVTEQEPSSTPLRAWGPSPS